MDDYLPWLILIRAPMMGPVQHKKLLDIYKSPSNVLSLSKTELEKYGLNEFTIKYIKNHNDKNLDKDIAWLNRPDHHFITIQDDQYPELLKEIADPPIGLFVDGNLQILRTTQIGIVGSRNPSVVGRQTSQFFARILSESGITVTSGLALGIDYCAHKGALESGGQTIAVLGNGLDRVYPARHKTIAHSISTDGALITEFPTGVPPLPEHFPRRNRLISGLSLGILVIEAAKRSGSLITARYAAEQGREVFAIPGSINNPLSRGCHYLIKQGAKLTESVEDIIEELNLPDLVCAGNSPEDKACRPGVEELDENYKQLLDCISYDPVSIDKLIEISGLTADTVSSMLLILEVHGVVSSSGGLYMRIN